MQIRGLIGAIALGLVVVGGCASSDSGGASGGANGGTTAAKKHDIKITMIAKDSANPVFQASKVGAEAAAEELGKQNGIKITIDWRTPPTEDGQEQARRIAQAVNDGTDYILISCSDADKVTGAINDAVAHGVPVMTFDSDDPDSKRFAFYGADDKAVGAEVIDELHNLSPTAPLNVAILAGSQNAPNLQKRVQGAEDEAKKYPNMKIVGVFNHQETAEDADQEVIKDDGAHPEINAWAMIGGWALFGNGLMTMDPAHYKIASVDAIPAELPYIDNGLAPVLLAQPVYDWGYKSVQIIVDKMNGKDVPVMNKMELTKVTKANLGDWARQLQKWGFTTVDPKYAAMK